MKTIYNIKPALQKLYDIRCIAIISFNITCIYIYIVIIYTKERTTT